jgi:dihydropteroate synthase
MPQKNPNEGMTSLDVGFPTKPNELGRMQFWQSPHARRLPEWGSRTLIMGILNATPDSFSDGGEALTVEAALMRADEMVRAGVDVIDIGGESTRPGSRPVGEGEEIDRVMPIVVALRAAWPDLALSIDTYKAGVALAVVRAGADMVNDVWGLAHGWIGRPGGVPEKLSPMAECVARLGCPVILMHNRERCDYGEFWTDVTSDLKAAAERARSAGIPDHQIWLDPGFGFAKAVPHNLEVIKQLGRIAALGHPVLVGTSRKSTLGKVLDRPVDQRLEGTAATVVWAIQQGCSMVRVHDVAAVKPFVQMADAIKAGLDFKFHG